MAADIRATHFSSDDDCEIVNKGSYPQMKELLHFLLTEIPKMAQNAKRELIETSPEAATAAEARLLKMTVREMKKQNEELERKLIQSENHRKDYATKTLRAKVEKLENRLDHEERSKTEIEKRYRKELQESQQVVESLKRKLHTTEEETRTLKDELSKRDIQGSCVKKQLESYEHLERQVKKLKEELKSTKDELEETKSRLSKSMGDKLTDNNPNIADLSDKNRPTKLAERFSEMYDNEWTDAFETIDTFYNDEEKTISVLFHILTKTRDFCDAEAVSQMDQIQQAISQNSSSPQRKLPTIVLKQLKDCRKSVAELSGKYLYQKYKKELHSSKSSIARRAVGLPEFVEACFNMCWLMAVQDPPIVFAKNANRGENFNTDIYKAFTKTGNKTDFVAWPALNLHTDGPVLCKGVAQGYTEVSRRSRSAPPKGQKKSQSSETTPDNITNAKTEPKLKTSNVSTGSRGSDRKLTDSGRNYDSSMRKVDNSLRNTPIARQSRTAYKPRNLTQCSALSPPIPKPSDNDIDTFLRWREMFGPREARRLMGQDYDICFKYLKDLGFI